MINTQAWIRRLLIPIALLAHSGLVGAQRTDVFPQGLDRPPYGPLKVGESKSIRVSCRDGQVQMIAPSCNRSGLTTDEWVTCHKGQVQAAPQVFNGVAAVTSSTLVSGDGVDGQPGQHVWDIWFTGLSAGNFDYEVHCGKKVGGKLEIVYAGGVGIAVANTRTPLAVQQKVMDDAALALKVAQTGHYNSVMACKIVAGCIPK